MIWMCMAGHAVPWKPTNPFSFEELCILLNSAFSRTVECFMGEINWYSRGRTSQLNMWRHILAPFIFQPYLTTVFLIHTFWEGTSDSLCLLQIMWVHHCHPCHPLVGLNTDILFHVLGKSLLFQINFESLVAPWPSSEELIAGFLICYTKGKLNLYFSCVGNEFLNIWQLSHKNVVFQLACLWSLVAWDCLRIPWISMERCKEIF